MAIPRPAGRLAAATAVLAAATAVLAALVAGCGRAVPHPAHPTASQTSTQVSTPTQASANQAPAGSRGQALALARRLLSLPLLPGARSWRPPVAPPNLRHPAETWAARQFVDLHRLFTTSRPPEAVFRYLTAHAPAGMSKTASGRTSGLYGVSSEFAAYALRSVPPGIDQAQLAVEVVAGPQGSLLRADAQVIWLPPRSPAEQLDPAAIHAATITARLGGGPKVRTVRQVLTSRAVIGRLITLLNRLPASPGVSTSCPAMIDTYVVAFSASAGGPPTAVVTAPGCAADDITVGGKAQPTLLDRTGRLAHLVRSLLHLRPAALR